ncbi:hypothetical protein CSB11_03070 [Candidatus Campbellbacteria bacterium]|nr:MAG: hypothetical protein CSB11_03070 [Candidatus Campbellbacteria bacterium]
MKKFYVSIVLFLVSNNLLLAEGDGGAAFEEGVKTFTQKITDVFLTPILTLLVAASVIYFVWGLVMFLKNAGEDGDRQNAKRHMLWGMFGLFIVFSVWGIMKIIMDTVNFYG